MPTMSLTQSYSIGSGGKQNTTSATFDAESQLSVPVPHGTTNMLVALAVAAAKIKGLYVVADKAMTLKTNSGGSPAQTFALAAGVPMSWILGSPLPCPITVDVTGLYLTNAGTTAADDGTLTVALLVDPT